MANDEIDWDFIRANAYSPQRPDGWPPNVTAVSFKGMALLGVDRQTRELYWDGRRIITERRVGLRAYELILATIVAVATAATAAWPIIEHFWLK